MLSWYNRLSSATRTFTLWLFVPTVKRSGSVRKLKVLYTYHQQAAALCVQEFELKRQKQREDRVVEVFRLAWYPSAGLRNVRNRFPSGNRTPSCCNTAFLCRAQGRRVCI